MLLLDDDREAEHRRNQLRLMMVMTGLFLVWMIFFSPKQTPPPQQPPVPVTSLPQADAPKEEKTPSPQAAPSGVALPPIAEAADPKQDELVVQDASLKLTFTKVGARLKQAEVLLGRDNRDSIQLVPKPAPDTADAKAVYPLGLDFGGNYFGSALDFRRWEGKLGADGKSAEFNIELPGEARVQKTFRLSDAKHVIGVTVTYTNLRNEPRVLGKENAESAFSLTWEPNVSSEDAAKGLHQELLWRKQGVSEHLPTNELKPPAPPERLAKRVLDADWAAVKSAYFVVAVKPEFAKPESWALGDVQHFELGVGLPRAEAKPGESVTGEFKVYIGPTHLSSLKQGWKGLDAALEFFTASYATWMNSFAKVLLTTLNWFHAYVFSNYGVAIVLLTLLVRSIMFPLTWRSMKSMKKMQRLAPELEKIKKEVGDDQQEMQKRMMELYREHGVNPVSGCFPIFLQMPVFIALYRMLWSAFELRRAPFLWIADLSEPDRLFRLPFQIPIPLVNTHVDAINLLPFLMGLAMLLSTKLMPTQPTAAQNDQQKLMMNIMPVIFCVFCYNVASGLNLYILVSTLLGIAQNYLVHVTDAEMAEKPKKSRWSSRPKHFYDAAQAKKREMHKEELRDKRNKRQRQDDTAGAVQTKKKK